ncbi:PaaI family thioesterase [Sphingomonas profundi]|uniref:PaaI family thioesterase n=1 Tax=Alterirhizorhabdus profundi TaxID=2681549 RepID=UPI0012E7D0A5|nr:PaaI family thioesterase [Sphingomonas profundi]
MASDRGRYGFAPDPEHAGWFVRRAAGIGRFVDIFGDIRVRPEGPATARMRVVPGPQHRNLTETVHGGFLLALVDQAYFVCPTALGITGAMNGLTVDSATQFLAPLVIDRPIDVVVEVLRETGRMIFMRGLIEQDDVRALAFSGTIRKASAR